MNRGENPYHLLSILKALDIGTLLGFLVLLYVEINVEPHHFVLYCLRS